MDIEVFDNEPIDLDCPGFFYLWCCDCGLRHLTVVDVEGKGAKDFKKSEGKVRIAMSRDDRATSLARTAQNVVLYRRKQKDKKK